MELVEYVVLHLSHIPFKELVALSVSLKIEISNNSLECCVLLLQGAFRSILFLFYIAVQILIKNHSVKIILLSLLLEYCLPMRF